MSQADRERWNARYASEEAREEPSAALVAVADLLPSHGRALDLAGGAGRNAIWLAGRGLDVTLVDVSDAAIALAEQRAAAVGVAVTCRRVDLDEGVPPGPWDLVVCVHHLDRDLLRQVGGALAPGGVLVLVVATVRHLERHERPPRPYLLDEGEAPRLVRDLEVVHHTEGWGATGRHEATLVARRPTATVDRGG